VPPRDPAAITTLMDAFSKSSYDIRSVLRVLLNSDFFKRATFAKIKSPAEMVVSTVRVTGGHCFPNVEDIELALETGAMGQQLLDPPSVEGWHTGKEWINTATLMARVNFASRQFADVDKPGVRAMLERLRAQGPTLSPERLVDACLDLMGPLTVAESTRQELMAHAATEGDLHFGADDATAVARVRDMLQLIVSMREYQLA
jgi:uncharacterized protein (DUF1800 family)